ncbi:MAG: hypothetical protein FWF46_06840 [Oscillospiraceae bacterium]|nr:hypothetical protein [Oscillospiraceae bacterium]
MMRLNEANRYFLEMVSKCYVNRGAKLGTETFWAYLYHRYADNCYCYSGYAFMGMADNDKLIRGKIDLEDCPIYDHGWLEFWYKDKEYVFDSRLSRIVRKKAYYLRFKPKIEYQFTKEEILSKYLVEGRATSSQNGMLWVVNKNIDNGEKGHINGVMEGAQIKLTKDGKVKKFVAYDKPNG